MRQNHCIGCDGRKAQIEGDEIGNYSRFIIDALAKSCGSSTYFHMYAPHEGRSEEFRALTKRENIEATEPDGLFWRLVHPLWQLTKLSKDAKQNNVELFLGLNNDIPWGLSYNNIRSVITIHDIGYLNRTTHMNLPKHFLMSLWLKSACERADRIIAVSEETKRDIVKRLNVNPDKIDVIHYGCHTRYTERISDEQKSNIKKRYTLPERYILTETPHKHYKNIEQTLRALPLLPDDLHYVVVGRRTRHTTRLEDMTYMLKLTERVHFIERVDECDTPTIYSLAEAYVTTSRHSGFSSSIVKALNVGIPVIATTGTSHEEAGGAHSIYIAPNNHKELAEKINMLHESPQLREKIVSQGRRHARQFRGEVIAYNLINSFQRIGIDLTRLR